MRVMIVMCVCGGDFEVRRNSSCTYFGISETQVKDLENKMTGAFLLFHFKLQLFLLRETATRDIYRFFLCIIHSFGGLFLSVL